MLNKAKLQKLINSSEGRGTAGAFAIMIDDLQEQISQIAVYLAGPQSSPFTLVRNPNPLTQVTTGGTPAPVIVTGTTTPAQIAAIPITTIPTLTPTQISALSIPQLNALTPAQIAVLTPSQIAALTPVSQVGALTPAQVAALTPAQIGALTPVQVAALSTTQAEELTPAQIAALQTPLTQMQLGTAATVNESDSFVS